MHSPMQERVEAGVFEKLIWVELSMKVSECTHMYHLIEKSCHQCLSQDLDFFQKGVIEFF